VGDPDGAEQPEDPACPGIASKCQLTAFSDSGLRGRPNASVPAKDAAQTPTE